MKTKRTMLVLLALLACSVILSTASVLGEWGRTINVRGDNTITLVAGEEVYVSVSTVNRSVSILAFDLIDTYDREIISVTEEKIFRGTGTPKITKAGFYITVHKPGVTELSYTIETEVDGFIPIISCNDDEARVTGTHTHKVIVISGLEMYDTMVRLGESKRMPLRFDENYPHSQKGTWASDDPSTVSVDEKGTVTGHVYGSAKITYTSDATGLSVTSTVSVLPTDVALDPPSLSTMPYEEITLTPRFDAGYTGPTDGTWSVEPEGLLEGEDGSYTPVKTGTATISFFHHATGITARAAIDIWLDIQFEEPVQGILPGDPLNTKVVYSPGYRGPKNGAYSNGTSPYINLDRETGEVLDIRFPSKSNTTMLFYTDPVTGTPARLQVNLAD